MKWIKLTKKTVLILLTTVLISISSTVVYSQFVIGGTTSNAVPTQPAPNNTGYTLANDPALYLSTQLDAAYKAVATFVSPFRGYVKAGIGGISSVNMNNVGGTAVGVFGIAEGKGKGVGEVVGVYGMAHKNGIHWATGLHGECLLQDGENDSKGVKDEGGLCIGVNIELIGNNQKSDMIGLNIQPRSGAHNVTGLQFQNPDTYNMMINASNGWIQIGQVDNVSFCMKFNPLNQSLEFWRNCNKQGATRTGFINMNYNTPNSQLNK